jgi:hypothetical protein
MTLKPQTMLLPQRAYSLDSTGSGDNTEIEVTADELAASHGYVATARKKKQLASVFSNASLDDASSSSRSLNEEPKAEVRVPESCLSRGDIQAEPKRGGGRDEGGDA